MDLVKSVFEQMNKKHRKDKSGLEDYTVDEKEMGIEVTSELKHSYILTVAFGGVAIFAVIMFVLLTVLNRRKKSGF